MTQGRRPPRILIADDDPEIRELLVKALTLAGYRVVSCEDGATALIKAKQGGFSLLILDYRMPRKLGSTVLKELRKVDEETPVLLMSCHLPDEVRSEVAVHAPVNIIL